MPRRIAVTSLNASTIDIINTIRANAPYEYQSAVPVVESTNDIPKVGEIIYGYPAFANYFISALVNRIALVRVKSANFNNMYSDLKKGYLENGETVEEVFVNIAKAREFSVEKAPSREFKRTIPDVRTAFHAMNWRVQYPVTIQDEDLRMAFTTMDGVQDLIARIVDAVYTANEYDEFLLFKYLMIKAIAHGKMYPVAVNVSDIKNSAVAYRGTSNKLQFMSTKYNSAGVTTRTLRSEQHIFMDAEYNAQFDVNVLASAFNMEKAEFMGKLRLIDDWTTFDNDRFSEIMEGSDQIEQVTSTELSLMADVIGVIVDAEWFQVYDNLTKFSEQYVASGLYWNYFLNVWKTVSSSPFSNAVVFVKNSATITSPSTVTFTVADKSVNGDGATVFTLRQTEADSLAYSEVVFLQTESATENGIAINKYGTVTFPSGATTTTLKATINGVGYTASGAITTSTNVGATITLAKDA